MYVLYIIIVLYTLASSGTVHSIQEAVLPGFPGPSEKKCFAGSIFEIETVPPPIHGGVRTIPPPDVPPLEHQAGDPFLAAPPLGARVPPRGTREIPRTV